MGTEGGQEGSPLSSYTGMARHSADVGRAQGAVRRSSMLCLPPHHPAEHRYYRHTRATVPSQRSLVDWGRIRRRHLNPGCRRVPRSFSMSPAVRLMFPSILPKSDI